MLGPWGGGVILNSLGEGEEGGGMLALWKRMLLSRRIFCIAKSLVNTREFGVGERLAIPWHTVQSLLHRMC
jgi:hypothetical protein